MIASLVLIFLYVSDAREQLSPRIVDGNPCSDTPHSFMVAILLRRHHKTQFLGGGTLLSPNWVLTVGLHFYTDPRDIDYEAVAGADSLSEINANTTHLQKSTFTMMYRTTEQIKRALDLAMLKLKKPMLETNRVSFVRFASILDVGYEKLEDICSSVTIMGYSVTKYDDEEKKDDKEYGNLRCSEMSIVPQTVCKKRLKNSYLPYQSGCVFGPKDACYGDAGGPVMCNGTQFGVLSYRYSCGEGLPSLFTRVYTYERFIRAVMEKNIDPEIISRFRAFSNTNLKNHLNNNFLNLFFIFYFLT